MGDQGNWIHVTVHPDGSFTVTNPRNKYSKTYPARHMKIAVLGLGFMGSTHVQAWRQIPGAQLAAVASRDPRGSPAILPASQGNLGGQGEKLDFSAVAKYTSAEEAVLDPAIEAVDICLPTHLHERIAMMALRAGKHVLVEKPMALMAPPRIA